MDEKTSNNADTTTFSEALSAAMNLTDTFSWPIDQYSFQSIYENVNVCINSKSTRFNEHISFLFKDANIYLSIHRSKKIELFILKH